MSSAPGTAGRHTIRAKGGWAPNRLSDPDAPPLDPAALIGALERHKVSFVTVGGLATQWQGAQRPTKDFDVCPAWDGENLERLAQALRDIGARLKVRAETTERLTIPVDGRLLSQMEITAWRTDAGDIDILLGWYGEAKMAEAEQRFARSKRALPDPS